MNRIAIIPNEEVELILQKLESIERNLTKRGSSIPEFVDNSKFCEIMCISKRTSQTWRDKGTVKFSQIGGKIYYAKSDLLKLLEDHRY